MAEVDSRREYHIDFGPSARLFGLLARFLPAAREDWISKIAGRIESTGEMHSVDEALLRFSLKSEQADEAELRFAEARKKFAEK